MRLTRVGMPFIPGVTTLSEGTTYNYTPGGHTLTLCVGNPTGEEIEAVHQKEAVFALLLRESTLFVLAKFGRLPWKGSYYNWWINAPAMRPDPWVDLQALNGGVTVNIFLVNAFNGILEALRRVTLSNEFSRTFLETVCAQTKPPFDPWRHAQVVDDVFLEFASSADMIKNALCMCAQGPGKMSAFQNRNRPLFVGAEIIGTA